VLRLHWWLLQYWWLLRYWFAAALLAALLAAALAAVLAAAAGTAAIKEACSCSSTRQTKKLGCYPRTRAGSTRWQVGEGQKKAGSNKGAFSRLAELGWLVKA
jgi:uncharacterized membrane protein